MYFSPIQSVRTDSGATKTPTELVRRGEGGCRLRFKRLKRDSDHSHPSGPKIKNTRTRISTPPVCFNGDRASF